MAVPATNYRNFALGLMLALGLVSMPSAFAQSWKITRGLNIGALTATESRKLPDGGTYLSGGARYVVDTEDPTYPITAQSMDCRWMCKVPAAGKDVACVTMCAGADKDGDLFAFRSSGPGTYEAIPGTGKYMKASGGGSFESVQPDDPAMTLSRPRAGRSRCATPSPSRPRRAGRSPAA
jgi:hypothetical protein